MMRIIEIIIHLYFITSNTGSRIHSQFGNLKIIKRHVPEPAVGISPADAEARNISSGQKIRVYNQSGEIFSLLQEFQTGCRQELLFFQMVSGLNEGGGGNHLIAGSETDMGYGAAFHDNRVEVERIY